MTVTNATGIGQDGYFRYQKEAAYGTDIVAAMTDLPIKEGTLIKAYPEAIENSNQIASRMKQDVQQGRIIIEGQIIMDAWPTLIGGLIQQLLGTAVSAAVAAADGAYDHYWFIPKTGVRIGYSMTTQQALGNNLVDQFSGCLIDSMTLTQDNQGNLELTLAVRGQNYTENIARLSSWTYPVSATNPPFMFGHATIAATPSGGTQVVMCADSLSLTINLNHKLERYKICDAANGAKIHQPVFNSVPTVELSANIDADQYFVEYARTHTKWDITLDWLHTASQAGSTPTYHQLSFELPGCLLAPDTEIPSSNDRVSMDVSLSCSFGGTTTNGGAAIYQGEVRLTDATAAYA